MTSLELLQLAIDEWRREQSALTAHYNSSTSGSSSYTTKQKFEIKYAKATHNKAFETLKTAHQELSNAQAAINVVKQGRPA